MKRNATPHRLDPIVAEVKHARDVIECSRLPRKLWQETKEKVYRLLIEGKKDEAQVILDSLRVDERRFPIGA